MTTDHGEDVTLRKPCRHCGLFVRRTRDGAWVDGDGFVNCAKFRRHWPDGEPPVQVDITPLDEAMAARLGRSTDA